MNKVSIQAVPPNAKKANSRGRSLNSGILHMLGEEAGRWKHASRIYLILLLLFAFARIAYQLGADNLWWDESLSLQRAESAWWDLLLGRIVLSDGIHMVSTVDQHPFAFFAVLGLLVRFAGVSEYVLRLPALWAAVLLVPILWAMGRHLSRRRLLPAATPSIVALLAAIHPFYLWYGQEARMYTWTALLAILSTYLLLKWAAATLVQRRRALLAGYTGAIVLFMFTHYFAVLVLPIHAVVIYRRLVRQSRRRALLFASTLVLSGAAIGGIAAWLVLRQPHSGRNFQPISLSVLFPDLLNAYSLGLSVDLARVWWLDLILGMVALLGTAWLLWRCYQGSKDEEPTRRNGGPQQRNVRFLRREEVEHGWVIPALVLAPIGLLLLINQVQPAYMNARHLSLISGAYLLLLAGGAGLMWRWHWMLGLVAVTAMVGGMAYSTQNYFTVPAYGKDNFEAVGDYLGREMAPGDLLLLNPPEMSRLYRYYLPVERIEEADSASVPIHWQSVPLLAPFADTEALLAELAGEYQRIWLVTSGMVPFADPERQVEAWLDANTQRVREVSFPSVTSHLELDLFLPEPPVLSSPPERMTELEAVFGDRVSLRGVQVGRSLHPGGNLPITYYWQALQNLDRRYKYRAHLEVPNPDDEPERYPATEREPYDGFMPTVWWSPEQIIMEHSALAAPVTMGETIEATLYLQVYDAETLETLPLTGPPADRVASDGTTLVLPLRISTVDLP